MEGYVRNTARTWKHALKRSVSPGQKIDLDILYAEYGEKHGIEEGKPFIDWLRSVKLKDSAIWEISYRDGNSHKVTSETQEVTEEVEEITEEKNSVDKPKPDNVNPFVTKGIEAADVVNFSVRIAKEKLPDITDVKLLKNALNAVKSLAGKDTLTIMLRKRIKELELAARR